jgi:hypothetical protein
VLFHDVSQPLDAGAAIKVIVEEVQVGDVLRRESAPPGAFALNINELEPVFGGCMIYGWSSTIARFVVANRGIYFSITEI